MSFKLQQKVIWITQDPETSRSFIAEGIVTKLGKDTIYLDNHHKPEDQMYAAFCYPDVPKARLLLETTLAQIARHKKESAELMSVTYQINNELVREGLK